MATSKRAAEAQTKQAARRASIEDLLGKRPLSRTVTLFSGSDPVEIEVQSIGRKNYADLVDACTETVERPKLDDDGEPILDDNGEPVMETIEELQEEEFFPRLIAASMTAAGLEVSVEQVKQFYDDWNASEFDLLAFAAYEVNTSQKVAQTGNA